MGKLYGLIGFPLGHSWSKRYFDEKFEREGIAGARFEPFPLEDISRFPEFIANQKELQGLSVTIPYKEQVIPYLDRLDESARRVGAVNSVRVERQGKKVLLTGYNTDVHGFAKSLDEMQLPHEPRALVLGTGGAAKAVARVMQQRDWEYLMVSRKPQKDGEISWEDVTPELLEDQQLIVNATPLGMYPKVEECPPLPYQALSPQHILFDLVYNPPETCFLKQGRRKGCQVQNGEKMLIYQAERSWQIWNA